MSSSPSDEWDDDPDAPFAFTGLQRHLARLRETYLHLDADGNLSGWTDQQLAERAGMTRAYVQQIMAGKADNLSMSKLIGLTNAFGVTPLYFFSESARRRVNRRLDARLDALRQQQLFGSREQERDAADGQEHG
ncbi:helix-turn-helix domain-containing protein [Luteipulveratus sp. YIM 133132]|uniref:helix-turn-helix domain-containing protein n=1 Tax=Luteipulveratus flavus TaxID=3031728 RepID=UPI0023B16D10|nr:helix-turn-helix domain-containing protein [Luteipulveratus sp. YIM 133132]MDE9364010.1 helix-turn-helix domain-containing protein [Luteipulveratus sp. YIM 133132]